MADESKPAGRTPAEVQRTIEERLGPRALQPQALVVIRRSVANSVSVAGESVKGTRVPLSLGGDRLLQVIAAAGGSNAPVYDIFVQLSRDGITATVPLATLVADPEENIFADRRCADAGATAANLQRLRRYRQKRGDHVQ